jgi:hypothetical protein
MSQCGGHAAAVPVFVNCDRPVSTLTLWLVYVPSSTLKRACFSHNAFFSYYVGTGY